MNVHSTGEARAETLGVYCAMYDAPDVTDVKVGSPELVQIANYLKP